MFVKWWISKVNQTPKINVDELVRLSKIQLSEDEKAKIKPEIEKILDFAECLQGYDVSGVELDNELSQIYAREDEVINKKVFKKLVTESKCLESQMFKIPRVLQHDGK